MKYLIRQLTVPDGRFYRYASTPLYLVVSLVEAEPHPLFGDQIERDLELVIRTETEFRNCLSWLEHRMREAIPVGPEDFDLMRMEALL